MIYGSGKATKAKEKPGSDTKYDVYVKGIENPSHYTSKGRGKGENWPRQYVARSCPMARGDRANLLVTKAVK